MDAHKLETRKQWNETPCGTGDYLEGLEYASLEFFDEVRRSRYHVTDEWMTRTIPFNVASGSRVLEIGHGVGTDLLTFRSAGADVYGIDITEEHNKLATRNFELHGEPCTLKLCDAAAIDFPTNYFDYVYSNGVLHHTPDTVRCISEAYRVLKPGGQLILSLYRTWSAFHLFSKLLYEGVFRGRLRRLGYRGLLATVEHGADGVRTKPLVKTYSRGQLRHVLADFSHVEYRVAHFQRDHIPVVGRLLPRALERPLEPVLGWYLVAFATK